MRAIVNISLPVQLNSVVEEELATGQYASKSEFFRSLLRSWMEARLAKELEGSRAELKAGKGKLLKSLSNLA
ncbi:MAG: type II toxin-antitoxin system ParD family antitoxin [Patescibacteria group bacterium]|nr:type II toxin-antitoxin system ParD family antitoxin [Patescibacteria group bacterium]